jgi:membrane-associated protease RseP (regulator of RpoE activity)
MEKKEPPVRKFECLGCKYSDYRMSVREVGETIPNECPKCGGEMKVAEEKPPIWLAEPLRFVSKYFDVIDFLARDGRVEAEVAAQDPKRSFQSILNELKPRGYIPLMREKEGMLGLIVVGVPHKKPGRIRINVLLLGATILTTFLAGYFFLFGNVLQAALFSCALMFMLGTHEMGHKIIAQRNGIDTTMPYFIPFPSPLGTLGAVINVKDPIPTRDTLVEVGAAGPLSGFAVAVPIVLLGLMLSKPDQGVALPLTPAIMVIMQLAVFGRVPVGLELNPLIYAGWITLVLTLFNLLPAGQLDGGHVARGFMGRKRHYTVTRVLGFALFFTGFIFPELPLWVWGFFIIMFFGSAHPGALDDVSGLSGRHKLLAGVVLVVFLLCLPVPVG